MNNQERNREALIEQIAEQDRIIRRRNEQISGQVERIEEAEKERDEARREAREWQRGALNEVQNHRIVRNELDRLRAEQPRTEMSSRNVVDFLADSLSNLSDSDRDYLSRILANSGR